jgi:hypothetical protein
MNWMACEIEFTDEFGEWWDDLTAQEQESVRAYVRLLEDYGVALRYPYCSGVETSKHAHMRELRVQHQGRPIRVLYAFDPRRTAMLLIGGDKTGQDRWYEVFVPIADLIYDGHIEQLMKEGVLSDGPEV